MKTFTNNLPVILVMIFLCFVYQDKTQAKASSFSHTKKLQNLIAQQKINHNQGARSQKKISRLATTTRDLIQEYRTTLTEIANTRAYNAQMRTLIKDQEQQNTSIRQQIVSVKQTRKKIVPLILDMNKTLKQFIDLDVPFLREERQTRLARLQKMMDQSNVSVSEKYRRLMEAYQIENEYGKTIETYNGIENINGKDFYVNYLRIGRLALIYQSQDGKQQAYWDRQKNKWVSLPSNMSRAITQGLKIARKQTAPTLLLVPVPAPIPYNKKAKL